MAKISDEELEMLSDEERAAIADDTEAKSTEEIKAEQEADAARVAKEEGGGAAVRSTDQKTPEAIADEVALEAAARLKELEDAEAVAKAAADKEAADLAAAEAGANVPPVVTPAKVEPAFVLEAERKHGTKEEIDAKMVALDTKFEDGDVTLAAYNKERAEYVEALTEMKMFNTINAQVQKAAAEKGWKDSQADFFRASPEYSSNRVKNVAFVDSVNRLLATDESKKMTDAQIFAAAKAECDAEFYPAGRKADTSNVVSLDEKRKAVEETARKAVEAAQRLEAGKAAAVRTLAKVPVSESNVGDDKYDVIDKLTGMAYEEAIAKMSDAERQVYAARG